jgi:hypothetical protein
MTTSTSSSVKHTNCTSSTHQQQHPRRVTFSRNAAIRPTISRKGLLPEEVQAAWFTAEECSSIQDSCLKQAIKMDNGKILKEKKYCSRGLEGHTKIGRITRSHNIELSIHVVLDKQELQVGEGIVDEMALAHVYQQTASSCQLWASAMGLLDQRAAEDLTCDEIIEPSTPCCSPMKLSPSTPGSSLALDSPYQNRVVAESA